MSIFSNILSLLFRDAILESKFHMYVSVFTVISLGLISYSSLFHAKEQLLDRPHPDTISNSIEDEMKLESIVNELENQNRPFSEIFESIKITLRSNDNQAAGDMMSALSAPFIRNLPDAFNDLSETVSEEITFIITQISIISGIAFEKGVYPITRLSLNFCLKLSLICYGFGEQDAGSYGIKTTYSSVRNLMVDTPHPENSLAGVNWKIFNNLFIIISRVDHERGIANAANLVSNYSLDVEEEYEPITSGTMLYVLSLFVESFLEGWETYVRESDDLPPRNEVYWGDPEMLEPGKYEYSFNHYIDNFETIMRSISRLESKSFPEPRIFEMSDEIANRLVKMAAIASKRGNEYLGTQFIQIAIICSARFNTRIIDPETLADYLSESFEDVHQGDDIVTAAIDQINTNNEKELFNTPDPYTHFVTILAIENKEDWFEEFQEYINSIYDSLESGS